MIAAAAAPAGGGGGEVDLPGVQPRCAGGHAEEFLALADRLDGQPALTVLHGLSFQLAAGESMAIVGPSGAGKSSLFALLGGSLHEDSGEFSLPPHWRMAQVAQNMPETDQAAATVFSLPM